MPALATMGGEEARRLAETLRRLVAETPLEGAGTVTASFGVAQRRPLEPAEAWFRRVDGGFIAPSRRAATGWSWIRNRLLAEGDRGGS